MSLQSDLEMIAVERVSKPAKPRPGVADLRIYWSKREKALLYDGSKPTGGMLSTVFENMKVRDLYGGITDRTCPYLDRTLAQELEARGYDLTTLRFSIRKKLEPQP